METQLLESLFDLGLFDPRGAARARAQTVVRTCWGRPGRRDSTGWFVDGGRFVTDDLNEDLVSTRAEDLEFVEFREEAAEAWGEINEGVDWHRHYARRHAYALWSAWLLRLGHEPEAASLLSAARERLFREEPIFEAVREELAWQEFSRAANAFIIRADRDALHHVKILHERFPDLADRFGSGSRLLTDLERRGRAKIREPRRRPSNFDSWAEAERVAWLINGLQQVDVRQRGQPAGLDLHRDPHVLALVKIGEPALPKLIECLQSDERLTRSMHFHRSFNRQRSLISVREVALCAIQTILHVRFFDRNSTGDSFSRRKQSEQAALAANVQAYWREYGELPLGTRVHRMLQSDSSWAWRQAAWIVARCNESWAIWTFGTERLPGGSHIRLPGHPLDDVVSALSRARERELGLVGEEDAHTRQSVDDLYRRAVRRLRR